VSRLSLPVDFTFLYSLFRVSSLTQYGLNETIAPVDEKKLPNVTDMFVLFDNYLGVYEIALSLFALLQ
jgi:hypothetical protein